MHFFITVKNAKVTPLTMNSTACYKAEQFVGSQTKRPTCSGISWIKIE